MSTEIDITRIAQLLDRLDPPAPACRVCGCVHRSAPAVDARLPQAA